VLKYTGLWGQFTFYPIRFRVPAFLSQSPSIREPTSTEEQQEAHDTPVATKRFPFSVFLDRLPFFTSREV
jgi:hypothetical protein